jgi:regulator of sirC expression with transglutaminase-like and TPR domain
MATDKGEIQALITLIDDPDETIYSQVHDRIIELGDSIVPELERAWEIEDFGDLFRNRIEDMLQTIHFATVTNRLKTWKEGGGQDLLEGTLIVSRYRYPDLDERKVKNRLSIIRRDIQSELHDGLTAYEKVRVFNSVFYGSRKFRGNKKNYHALQNNYINEVLESRTGNPLSLAIIYQVIARELGIPVSGVNLPNHFVLAYMDEEDRGIDLGAEGVLFYVNAFSQGDILGRNEINEFLTKLKIEPKPYFYVPCTNIDIIRRQLNNLMNGYGKRGDAESADELQKLLGLLGEVED